MDSFDSFIAVLDFAIDKEIEANRFYVGLAKTMKSPAMRQVFEAFANEELGHKAKLEAIKQGQPIQPAAKVMDLRIADYVVDVKPGPDMSYQDALVLAMRNEKAAFRLYVDLADQVQNEDQKAIFLALAQEEARHKLRFEIEYDEAVLTEN
ncbi:MAG TPA: ferritin family protein [Sedimentisphaerales bacterium]|nr:ferritin family protein [Sedimentisphaerales bacterium]